MLYLIFSIILFPYATCMVEDLFGFNVDELFSTMIGPVYKVRRTGHTTPAYLDGHNFTRINHPGVTAHGIYQNCSEDPQLKKKLDLERLLNEDVSGKPNFEEDEIQMLSRRFDKVLEADKKPDKPILRELYFEGLDDIPMVRHSKYMVIIIMQHFLYQTRYKMPFAQKMRQEYMPRIRYKIGFAFALLRILKTKQYVLYSVMARNRDVYDDVPEFLKLFEKIIRLDVEIKALILLIKDLEKERVKEFELKRVEITLINEQEPEQESESSENKTTTK